MKSPAHAPDIGRIIAFWTAAGPDRWFSSDAHFDREFREGFLDQHMRAAARQCDDWCDTPHGALALLLLLDQFPRNAFRGTAHMYATDPLARRYARQARAAGHMDRVEGELRLFFCLPFEHSEDLADQDTAVALIEQLGPPSLTYAEGHRDIIRRFGRFPHRNPMLGRDTTPEEQEFLAKGGFAG